MSDLSRLCVVCFNEKDQNGVCRFCRGDDRPSQPAPLLPLRCVVGDRYYIGKALKVNSEGVTYSAYDLKMARPCSVREFFPEALVSRSPDGFTVSVNGGCEGDYDSCRVSFLALWNKLLRLRGLTALVSVSSVFRENNTAYAVYDESERYTLRDYLLETDEGFVSWEKARILLFPALSTLATLHTSGVLHRGIHPEAFIFSQDGKLKLTDFCIEQARTAAGDINAELFDGYTPLEQYSLTGNVGTWSDVYSFCAVLYRALIGTNPINAKTRARDDRMMIPGRFAEKIPSAVIGAVINGMQVMPSDRTRTVEQLRMDFSSPAQGYRPAPSRPPQSPQNVYVPESGPGYADRQTSEPPPARPQPQRPVRDVSPTEKIERLELEKEEEEKKSHSKTALIAVLAVTVVILLGVIGAIVIRQSARTGTETTETSATQTVFVPTFVRANAETVQQTYKDQFTFIIQTQNSAEIEAGYVVNQSIPANTEVAVGSTITLIVSSGKDYIVMDSFIGTNLDYVTALLEQHNIKISVHERLNDGTHSAKTVISTSPGQGETVYEGDTVTVYVWGDSASVTNEYVDPNQPGVTVPSSNEATTVGSGVDAAINYPGLFGDETTSPEPTTAGTVN